MEILKKKKKKGGFTLIELLVVIAIIGILLSAIVVSVNSSRNRAKNSAIKSTMLQMREQAEMFYDDTGNKSYVNWCINAAEDKMEISIVAKGGTAIACKDSAVSWCISSSLVGIGAGNFCVDSAGAAASNCCLDAFVCGACP